MHCSGLMLSNQGQGLSRKVTHSQWHWSLLRDCLHPVDSSSLLYISPFGSHVQSAAHHLPPHFDVKHHLANRRHTGKNSTWYVRSENGPRCIINLWSFHAKLVPFKYTRPRVTSYAHCTLKVNSVFDISQSSRCANSVVNIKHSRLIQAQLSLSRNATNPWTVGYMTT